MIKLFKDDIEIPFKQWKFPGGEVGVQLQDIDDSSKYCVHMYFEGSDDIMFFLNVCDALIIAEVDYHYISAYIPYLPYARQDRVCHSGESFALEVFMYQLAQAGCLSYTFCDVHSQVALDLLDLYCVEYSHQEQWACAIQLPEFDVMIAPDKGALSKIYDHTQVKIGNTVVVCLSKTRTAGSIVYDDYEPNSISGDVCVVDDLCDFGGTFLALGEMLKRTQPHITKLSLYVTHGLLGKGTSELKKYYDEIYAHNLMNQSLIGEVTVI